MSAATALSGAPYDAQRAALRTRIGGEIGAKVRADFLAMERAGAARYSRERFLLNILRGHFVPEIRIMPAQADIVPLLERVLENHRRWGNERHRFYSFAAHLNARCALLAERALAMGDAA